MPKITEQPTCTECSATARWAIAAQEGVSEEVRGAEGLVRTLALAPVIHWFACGHHLSKVLSVHAWQLESVTVFRLGVAAPPSTNPA